MSSQQANEFWLCQLKEHLKQERYSLHASRRRMVVAGRFLAYLNEQHIAVEDAETLDVSLHLQNELRLFHRRHHHAPRSSRKRWRHSHTAGIHLLLRLAQGKWPPARMPSNLREVFHRELCGQYDEWMHGLRGLAHVCGFLTGGCRETRMDSGRKG